MTSSSCPISPSTPPGNPKTFFPQTVCNKPWKHELLHTMRLGLSKQKCSLKLWTLSNCFETSALRHPSASWFFWPPFQQVQACPPPGWEPKDPLQATGPTKEGSQRGRNLKAPAAMRGRKTAKGHEVTTFIRLHIWVYYTKWLPVEATLKTLWKNILTERKPVWLGPSKFITTPSKDVVHRPSEASCSSEKFPEPFWPAMQNTETVQKLTD